jgi:hypothetical protein
MTAEPNLRRDTRLCIGEPVSWLRLEQHRLRELAASDALAVEAHLAMCPACTACAEETNRPLALSPPDAVAPKVRREARLGGWRTGATAGGVLAAAAAMALVVVPRSTQGPDSRPGPVAIGARDTGSKGGDVAMELVRERMGLAEYGARAFLAGDRWKVLVTCPVERVLFWDVAIHEAGRSSFPLVPAAPIACGNRVALPGAFQLTGAGAKRVCLVLAGDPAGRRRFAPASRDSLDPDPIGGAEICLAVRPEESGPGGGLDPGRR